MPGTSSGRAHTTAQTETQPHSRDEQREGTYNSTNRNTATCPDKVVPRNNNEVDSSSAKGTIPLRMVKVNDRNM
jgi:hypothetical protein